MIGTSKFALINSLTFYIKCSTFLPVLCISMNKYVPMCGDRLFIYMYTAILHQSGQQIPSYFGQLSLTLVTIDKYNGQCKLFWSL